MHIYYGVQGTGNGHITRARVMAKELALAGIQVDFQFSGRAFDQYFDMSIFNNYQLRQGMTLAIENGQNSYLKTVLNTQPITFIKEVKALDLLGYDLVISDFEPVSAWAARLQDVPVLGIGHQYAFQYKVPKQGSDPLAELVMKFFAPVDIGVGLHWQHFGQPILPPIIERPTPSIPIARNKILVYLPFEDTHTIIRYLRPFKDFDFHIYTPDPVISKFDFISCHTLSRDGFQNDLQDCVGIISNAGFALVSEALYLGKKILIKPIQAHMEQLSNALALRQLGYGYVMPAFNTGIIQHWLHEGVAVQVSYPNTANILVQWIQQGMPKMHQETIEAIWDAVDIIPIRH